MRFTTIIVSVFAAVAMAAPQIDAIAEGSGEVPEVEAALEFSMSPMAECSHLKCLKVLGAAACVAGSIAAKKPQNLVRCVKGGKNAICPCAGCIDKLNGFLTEHHVCQ